ncbi:YkgJ family cysteine cluster protein [Pseudomonas sp. SWRI107]|uniref:YkgJ family cysteine cluster protein n=1 Tax=Pseudomonas farsensis TaxID=2745492 RepID=UPI0016446C4F|nr:YkgJ family cysteine cluster protein [Pseudomonas farsensis]MBV4534028.1 YkgJ family cysteine cluster protein [Pseudomonas farsensis]
MENNAIRFACNGCGICCKGRLIPLTLHETRQWLKRGHEVAILLEAFDELHWSPSQEEFAHAKGRAVEVTSGDASIRVIAVFAGNALNSCQNLGDNNLCGIYDERPLVCRIYPAEINPFITLNPASKICPPEVWEEGEVLFTDRVIDPVLVKHIERSRKADRDDARAKIALCEILGLNVVAWKGNAFAVYLPDRQQLLDAFVFYDTLMRVSQLRTDWKVRVDTPVLRQKLQQSGVALDDQEGAGYIFHSL